MTEAGRRGLQQAARRLVVGGERPRSPIEEGAGSAQLVFGAGVRVSEVYKIINSRSHRRSLACTHSIHF